MRKNTYIAAALSVVVIAVLVFFGFFNIPILSNSSTSMNDSTMPTDTVVTNPMNATDPEVFLNTIRDMKTVSELLSYETSAGEGDGAATGDTVIVHYTGILTDGTPFDTSRQEGREPFPVVLGENRVIQGWEIALQGMKKGSRKLVAIPASLAYGDRGQGSIPPGATLIFDIEVLDIIPGK